MVLANLKVSRKLALGLMCVLVVFAVTATAFFFTLLSIDRASGDVASATTLNRHLVTATAALYDEQQALIEGGDSSTAQASAQRFAAQLTAARAIVDANPSHAAITGDIDEMEKEATAWRRQASMNNLTSTTAYAAFNSARAAAESAKSKANAWVDRSRGEL